MQAFYKPIVWQNTQEPAGARAGVFADKRAVQGGEQLLGRQTAVVL